MLLDTTNDLSALYAGFLSLVVLVLNSFVNWLRNKGTKKDLKTTFDSIGFQFDPENKESLLYKVNSMQKELITNGGSSVKDMVMKTHMNMEECNMSIKTLKGNMAEIKAQMRARMELQLDESMEPIFLCDEKGECTFVNKALEQLFGLSFDDMLGFGWLKAIKDQLQKEVVHRSWLYSTMNRVPFNIEYTIWNDIEKKYLNVVAYGDVKLDDNGKFMFFFGKVKIKE